MTEHVIERLGHQGDGIAPGPVFAPMTLPGEVVSGTLNGQRLEQVRIVTPSSDRVAAPCRHFKTCGGCQNLGPAGQWQGKGATAGEQIGDL